MIGKRIFLPVKCYIMSLIGCRGDFPRAWGNYFSIWDKEYGEVRIVNFWWENLQEAEQRFFKGSPVETLVYKSKWGCWAMINDARIPDEWYYDKLCFTGGYAPPLEIAQEMYLLRGDPTNELEQFTDPVAYYKKRGGSYNPETGVISYNIGKKP